jgi:hypothetical protein
MTEATETELAPKRGPGRPPGVATDAAPKLVEVQLKRRFVPNYLVGENDVLTPNAAMIKETLEPGVYRLHPADAHLVLTAGVAQATPNTFKGI